MGRLNPFISFSSLSKFYKSYLLSSSVLCLSAPSPSSSSMMASIGFFSSFAGTICIYSGLLRSFTKHFLLIRCCFQPRSPAPMSLWQRGHLLAWDAGFQGRQVLEEMWLSYSLTAIDSWQVLHCLNSSFLTHSLSKWELRLATCTIWAQALQLVSMRQPMTQCRSSFSVSRNSSDLIWQNWQAGATVGWLFYLCTAFIGEA